MLVCCSHCTQRRTGLTPGDYVPHFELNTIDGRTLTERSFDGKGVLISFWASWCEPCKHELPMLERLHAQLHERGGTVVGIGIDDSAGNLRALAREHALSFPILVDDHGEAKQVFRVKGVPESFLIDKDGKIALILEPGEEPKTRIVGPREWDSPQMAALVFDALKLVGSKG